MSNSLQLQLPDGRPQSVEVIGAELFDACATIRNRASAHAWNFKPTARKETQN
jgi:hypothetical protein